MHTRCKARTEHAKVGWRANHDDDDIRFEATTADWLRLTASTLTWMAKAMIGKGTHT